MKKIVLMAILLLCFQITAQAQEKEPLVMRILLDWSVAGAAMGVAVGGAVWLTDPGRPGNRLADQVAIGAAWGAIAGAGFGMFVLSETAIHPSFALQHPDPLHPSRRITGDPIGEEEARADLLATAGGSSRRGRTLVLPLLDMRF